MSILLLMLFVSVCLTIELINRKRKSLQNVDQHMAELHASAKNLPDKKLINKEEQNGKNKKNLSD